jgi:hypothetical protein
MFYGAAMQAARLHILRFLTVAFFLAAQLSVALHTAKFGPEQHRHHGAACDIQLFSEHAKASALPSLPVMQIEAVLSALAPVALAFFHEEEGYRSASPRGPPFHLFS